jgi:hypothetical protein
MINVDVLDHIMVGVVVLIVIMIYLVPIIMVGILFFSQEAQMYKLGIHIINLLIHILLIYLVDKEVYKLK